MNTLQTEPLPAVPLHRLVGPRVRTISKTRNEFEGRYKGHDIYIRRENRNDPWYITVTDSEGCRAYDGWWIEEEGRIATIREAIIEACKGSLLWPNVRDHQQPEEIP